MPLSEDVAASLAGLVGQRFWGSGRAAGMQWFQFGERRKEWSHVRKQEREVGEFALHVQCTWRLRGPDGIVVASRDMYYPRGPKPDLHLPDFDWDQVGANRCDERVESFISQSCPLSVLSVSADDVGGFQLLLEKEYVLEVFPDDSLDDEHWRFLQPSVDRPHVVLKGASLITE